MLPSNRQVMLTASLWCSDSAYIERKRTERMISEKKTITWDAWKALSITMQSVTRTAITRKNFFGKYEIKTSNRVFIITSKLFIENIVKLHKNTLNCKEKAWAEGWQNCMPSVFHSDDNTTCYLKSLVSEHNTSIYFVYLSTNGKRLKIGC